jgi:hypothetical protein
MNINSIVTANCNVRLALQRLKCWNWFVIVIKTEYFSTCRVDKYKFFFSILNNNMTLYLWFWIKIEFPISNACFALRCLNLWNPIWINIKHELFSEWQVHIFNSIFLLSLKITWLYSFQYEYKLDSDRELKCTFGITVTKFTTWLYMCEFESENRILETSACFAWRCLNLRNPILINMKPEQFSTWQFHI